MLKIIKRTWPLASEGEINRLSADEQQSAELIAFNVNNGNLSEKREKPLRTTAPVAKGQFYTANGMTFQALTSIPAGDIITVGTNSKRVNAADIYNL